VFSIAKHIRPDPECMLLSSDARIERKRGSWGGGDCSP